MANEISWSELETDAGLAHYLAGELAAKLYDPTDLRSVMFRRLFRPGMASETMKVTQYSRAQSFTSTTSEIDGSNVSNSDIDSGNHQLTVVRKTVHFESTELWRRIQPPSGTFTQALLEGVIVEAAALTMTDLACALFPSVTAAEGSQTGDMEVDYLYDAQFALNVARCPGPFSAVLRPKAFNEFQEDLRNEGGTKQWQAATDEQLHAKGPGFKGLWNGWNIWDSDSVEADGSTNYYQNCAFGQGAFEYTEAPAANMMDVLPPNVMSINAGGIFIVRSYDQIDGTVKTIGSYFPAVALREQGRAVEIQTQVA